MGRDEKSQGRDTDITEAGICYRPLDQEQEGNDAFWRKPHDHRPHYLLENSTTPVPTGRVVWWGTANPGEFWGVLIIS